MQRYKRTCMSFFVITKASFSGPSLSYFISFVYSFTVLPYIFVFLLSSDSHEQKCSYDKHDETNKSTQQIVMRKSIHVMRPFVHCNLLFHKNMSIQISRICTWIFLFGCNVNFLG